jgi:hypothetical protein
MHMKPIFAIAALFIGACAMKAGVADPTVSSSASGAPLEFSGTVVEEGVDYVILSDASHPDATVKVRRERVLTVGEGRVLLVPRSAGEAAAAPPPSAMAEDSAAELDPAAAHSIRAECRGLVRFRCFDDGTSEPIGACFGIYDCREEAE